MKTTKETNRRGFIDQLFKGLAFGTIAGVLFPKKIHARDTKISATNIYAMWTHGSEGKMEGAFHSGQDAISIGAKMMDRMKTFHSAGYFRGSTGRGARKHYIAGRCGSSNNDTYLRWSSTYYLG